MGTHPPILLDTLGMTDSLILMVLALVVFGPRRLPQIAKQLGKLMYEFRKASNDFKFQMEEELRNAEEAERRRKEEERQRSLAVLAASEQASVSADPPAPANTVESPYPGEGQYPETTATSGDSIPRIAPPSTGETVAAERPTWVAESPVEAAASTSPDNGEQETSETPSQEKTATHPQEAAEALNQHG